MSAVLPVTPTVEAAAGYRLALRRFARNRLAVAGLAVVVLFLLLCFAGPLLYSTDQTHTNLTQVNLAPSGAHLLGTDAVGHDELGRLMYGGKVSLLVGLASGLLATVIGTLWGAIAGYAGGWIDAVMMRVVDAGIAIPALFVLLVVSAITTPDSWGLVVVLGLVSWLVPSRLVRAETLTLKGRDYVLTLRAIGGTHGRAIARHILPNSVSTIVVAATFQVADAILLVAYVSYLGLGVQPPSTDWGGMLSAGLTAAYSGRWWLIVPPGLAIILVVCAFNAIGDGLRDAFDVRGARMTADILRIENLGVTFATETGEVAAVRDVSLRVRAGETLALVGESGSGKSTVALAAMGLLPGSARATGHAVVGGTDVIGAPEEALAGLRGRTASMVFQEPATALDPLTRIGAQIAEVIRNHRPVTAKEAAREAVALLRRVGIPDPETRASAFPFQLSGGQRQRVVIAMAVANAPSLLIADEPTTALDVTVQAEILDLLRGLAAHSGTGVLLVTHNMGVVADFADRVAVMFQGEIVETGPVEDVLLRPTHEYTARLLGAVPRLAVAGPGVVSRAADGHRPAADPVVDLREVSVRFGRGRRAVRALDGVSLTVRPGETVGLVGESGSGKSTAARVALGLVPPSSGSVSLFGADLGRTRGRARRALLSGVGVVLQDPVASLDARMSVAECVAEPLRVHRRRMSAAERRSRVGEVLELVRLPGELAHRGPRELSGGQRQRVSLARALVLEPRLLVADEPTSALDVSVQRSVLEVIAQLQEELGFACLFVSHDLAVVQHFAQHVVVMRAGRVEEEGSTATTLLHPRTDHTRRLIDAVPVPDPVLQRRRRAERQAAAGVTA